MTPKLQLRNVWAGALALSLASCTTITTFENSETADEQPESEGSGGLLPTTSTEGSAGSNSGSTSSAVAGSSSADTGSSGDDGNTFLNDATTDSDACGGPLLEGVVAHTTSSCEVLRQDCCPGDACRPWANDGGSTWNSTRCFPIDPAPASVGEACVLEGSVASGLDNCDFGLICWNADPETLEGTCIEHCTGTPDDPVCTNADEVCSISNQGVLALCLPSCDLVQNDCDGEGVCIPAGEETFGCIDPRYVRCPAGTTEVGHDVGVDCTVEEPCCAAYCDLSDPASCEGELGCEPLPEPFSTYPNLGLCMQPGEP